MHNPPDSPRMGASLLGGTALVLWSFGTVLSRLSALAVGPWATLAAIHWIGVLTVWVYGRMDPAERPRMRPPPWRRVVLRSLFVAYVSIIYFAIGIAPTHATALTASLMNLTWPAMVLLGATILFGPKPHPAFYLGQLLCLTGAFFALTQDGSPLALDNLLSPALAFLSAMVWGAYSNLLRRWHDDSHGIMFGNLLAVAVISTLCFPTQVLENLPTILRTPPLLILGVITNLALVFWGIAMRRGHADGVALLAYFLPLSSVLVTCWLLSIPMGWRLLAAGGSISLGALLCKWALSPGRRTEVSDQRKSW